jgi:energy-coupling factor transporter ATP-binding protein EcfA2/energy-coupling factor transporter transmembrane protein EcfT
VPELIGALPILVRNVTLPPVGQAHPRVLDSIELAEAVVLGDLTLALCLVSRFVPLGSALLALGLLPMAAISARHRVRAAFVGGLAAMFVGFLAAGDRVVLAVGVCTAIGALVGHAHRRHWGAVRTVATGIVLFWPPASLVTVGLLAAFTTSRRLAIDQTRNSWSGTGQTLRNMRLGGIAHVGDVVVNWETRFWWLVIPIAMFAFVGAVCNLGWFAARGTLHTLDGLGGPRSLLFDVQDRRAPAPVPVRMDDVSFRYPGSEHWAVRHVALQLEPSEFLTIVGHNGSGKSTLARMLVGAVPTEGTITRGGAPGLGARDGSALIFQRPDAQVLGVRVRDDLRWGLPSTRVVDTEDLLARVGLEGFSDRETATLSGGELQRLAVASALARQPRLVVSDESTAMLDPEGRVVLMNLLRSLPDEGVSVVHVTHDPLEASAAPHALALSNGRRVDHVTPIATPSIQPSLPSTHRPPPQALSLKGVGHVYSPGTPWERRSLAAVNLEIAPGSGVAVNGPNGSGKSTLAWILAGLTLPTEGEMLLGGRSLAEQVGRVGLSFQHARLQLLQRRVLDDVRDAGGSDDATAADALWSVGLDPSVFGSRQVDQLSGGEQRRVAIAGMLARQTSVLVLDEPFAGLDKAGSLQLVQVLAHLRAEWGITLIIVSHDNALLGGIADRFIRLEAGRVVSDSEPTPPPPAVSTASVKTRRPASDLSLLRLIPGSSPLHRLWAGTKLLAVGVLSLAASLKPTWPILLTLAGVVLVGLIAGRIPMGALPRVPRWFLFVLALGAVLSVRSSAPPLVHLGSLPLSLGGLSTWGRLTMILILLVLSAALIGWTTPLGEIPAALTVLGRPLRRLGLPIEEWVNATALAIRSLPSLIDESRTLIAARRLRRRVDRGSWRDGRQAMDELGLLAITAITVALRRARDLSDAITARGGFTDFDDPASRPQLRDVAVLAVLVLVVASVLILT